ncbi:MAG TPA: hypothetical protein VGB98_07740 [Pyrinomonadaceae bacterium]
MKHVFRLSRARALVIALAAVFGAAAAPARAQTPSATPDTAIFQITTTTIPGTPTPTPTATPATTPTPGATPLPLPRDSFAGDISGSGRFVVIESNGDIATDRSDARNNADGNHEIFLFDYAQRRIFQITNTTSVLKDATRTAVDPTNIDVAVVNINPSLSRDGKWIVFASNAYSDADGSVSPKNFIGANHVLALKGNGTTVKPDGNTEIFIYRIPDVADINLSQGTEVANIDLAANTPQRVTFTDTTAAPRAATTFLPAAFALDNYAPSVNDDGSLVAFISKARTGAGIVGIAGANNPDGNKELFLYRNSGVGAGTFLQLTTTADVPIAGSLLPRLTFNESPSISSCPPDAPTGCRIAFLSNADNITTVGAAESDANEGNGEIFVVDYDPVAGTKGALRQITRTPPDTTLGREGVSVNILSEGRRISRDGTRVAFESTAGAFNPDGTINGSIVATTGVFIANVTGAAPAPTQVSARAPSGQFDVELHFPTFTGDSTRLLWASNLNLRADGTVETAAGQGLNQLNRVQIFSAPLDALTSVSRVTNLLTGSFSAVQPFPADTFRRMALTLRNEQGGGNPDGLAEAHYQLIPVVNPNSETPAPSPTPAATAAPVSFFTGASDRAVVPTPTPPQVSGLAPGMLGIMRSTLALAPATVEVDRNNAHETQRRPPLPVELSGVTVTVSGSAAGLFFVGPNQINFVVPPGLAAAATAAPVAVFNNGTLIRTSVLLTTVQPDIFTSTNGPGGRAAALNVTNPCVNAPGEPFPIETTRPAGSGTTGNCTSPQPETVATQVMFLVTGVRGVVSPSSVTVRIGTTDITGTADPLTSPVKIGRSNTPGFDQITVTLPASLAGAGDVPVIITIGTATSRPADTAPRITIQ